MGGRSLCWRVALAALSLGLSAATCWTQSKPAIERELRRVNAGSQDGPFRPDWHSLAAYRVPAWFRDAKFGIFIHWGVYSVPAFGNEWYSRNMYVQGTPAFQHQIATYGPQSRFGYKDFIPMFRGERFNAAQWVDLFARAGARYVVPVAEHCDGFAMYNSHIDPWNAAKMGPHRDIVGELAAATSARGLHFGVSSHRAEHWWWYDGGMKFDSDVRDSRYASLYGPAQPMSLPGNSGNKEPDPNHLERWLPPNEAFLNDWLARSAELVDKYHPDFFYFDWWIGQPAFRGSLQKFAAYYYNQSADRHQPVVLTYKQEAMPAHTAVLDIERGKMDAERMLSWETDTSVSIHSWGYAANDQYRDAGSLIDELVDVVSKNGNLLLNVGPRADGTIPEQVQSVLLAMGAWLRVNGEAIYGSRPWFVYGEGPTRGASTAKDTDRQQFTAADIRYTTRGSNLYAIALGWPANGELRLQSLFRGTLYLPGPVCSVDLLGNTGSIAWKQQDDGVRIQLPGKKPDEPAYVFRIRTATARGCGNSE